MSDTGEFNIPVDLVVDLVGGFDKALGTELGEGIQAAFKTVFNKMDERLKPQLTRTMKALETALQKGGVTAGKGLAGGMVLGFKGEAPKIAKAAADSAKIWADAAVKAEVEATKRARARSRADVQVAQIKAPAELVNAQARGVGSLAKLTQAQARYKVALQESVRASAALKNAEAALLKQQQALQISAEVSERTEKRLQATRISNRRAELALPVRQQESSEALERSRLNRIRVETETAARERIESARRARQIDVAETQQDEKRKTLRLQRFNALFLQLTQAGLTKVRDARRLGAQRDIAQQQSQDKEAERVLRESLSRREQITRRFEARTLAQTRTTQRLVDARTSTGVLGAVRGASPLGASLRSLALVGGGALSIRAIFQSAQTFLANFRRLGAITGATDAQLQQLRKTAIALGNDLSLPGVSAGDATEALTRLVQAGFSVDQAVGAAKGTLLLARNNMIDFSEAAQFTGSAINSFGINATDALRAVDVAQKSLIAGGGQSFTELSQAIQQSGAVFSEFFAKTRGPVAAFEDMNIALDILAKNGLRGSDAGTSLKTFLIGLTGPSEAASKKIGELSKQLGVSGSLFFDAAGNARPFIESIKNLRESMKDLTQEQRLQELKLLFGTDAFRAAAIFIGQTDAELVAFEKTIRESAGSSEKLGRAVNQGMRAAFDNFSSVIETAGILLIEKIDKPLGAIIGKFAELTSSLLQGQGVWEVARAALAGIAVALGAVLAAKGAVEVMGLMKGALLGLTSPAGAALTVIALLGAAIGIGTQASDEFRESLHNLAQFVSSNVLDPVRDLLGGVFGKKPTVAPLTGAVEPLVGLGLLAVPAPVRATNAVFDAIAKTIDNVLVPALQTAVDFIRNTVIPGFGQLVRFIDDKVEPILRRIGTLFSDVAGLIAFEAQQRILPTLRVIADGFRDGFRGLAGDQAKGVIGFFQDLARVIGRIADAGGALFAGNFSEAGSKLADLGSSVGRALLNAVKSIDFAELAKTIFIGLGTASRKAGSALTTVFSEPVLKALLGAAAAVAAVAADIAVNFAIGFVKGMQGRIDDITRVVVDVLKIAGKAALLALGLLIKEGLPALLNVALSGPLGLLAVGIAAAFGAKLFNKINTGFFKPFAAQSKAIWLTATGHVQQAQDGYAAFGREQKRIARNLANDKRRLGDGLFAGFILGAGKAATALGHLTDIGVGQALAAGVATYVGAWQGGFAQIVSLAGAAALAIQQLATGNYLGAAITGVFAVVGTVFGSMARKSQEAKERVKEFTEALKSSTTASEGFAAGLQQIIDKDKGLQDALAATGLTAATFQSSLFAAGSPAANVAKVSGALDGIQDSIRRLDIDSVRTQLFALGDALPRPAVDAFIAEMERLQTTIVPRALGPTMDTFAKKAKSALLDAAAGASEAGQEIQEVIDEVLDSIKQTTLKSALSLDVSKLTEGMVKVRAESGDLGAALEDMLPSDLELQFDRIAASLGVNAENVFPNLAKAVSGTNTEFEAFRVGTLNALVPLGATQREAKGVDIALKALRDAYLDAAGGAKDFAAAQSGVARSRRLAKIAEDWNAIEKATDDAKGALDEYFVAVRGGASAQEAIDTAVLAGSEAVDNFHKFLTDHPGIKVSDLFILSQGKSVEAASFRKNVIGPFQEIVGDFMDNLPDEIKADPTKSRQAISEGLESIFQLAIAQGFPAELLRGYFDIDALLATLAPLQTQAVEKARLMREAIAVEFTKPLPIGTDFLTGAIPEVDLPSMVLQEIQIDDAVSQEIKDYIAEHSAEAVAEVKNVSFNQANTDTALKTALVSAQNKLPPIKVHATITDIDVLDRALQGISMRIRAAAQRALSSGGGGGIAKQSAEGRIVTSEMMTTVGERGPEAIIPLTKPRRALELLKSSGLAQLILRGSMGSLKGAGRSVGEGAALGISEASGMVAGATAHLAGVISSTFTRLLGIHSPSTLFEKYGKDIIEGLMKGLKEGAQAAGSSIREFVDIFLGNTGTGGAVATGIDQLLAETKKQLVDALKELGDTVAPAVSEQTGAFSAIAEFAKGAGGSTFKDKKGKVHRRASKFATGFNTTTAAGAENRSALVDVISAARDAIVEDIAAGDTAGAQAVFKQLQAALKKAGKAKKGNQAAIDEILGGVGLGGVDPLADIVRQFQEATEEMRRLTEAETQRQADEDARKAAQRQANTPPTVNNNFQITSPFDPFEVARRATRMQEMVLARAWQG